MKKSLILTNLLTISFVLTGCNLSKLLDIASSEREGATYQEFHNAALEADQNPRSYTGFICSAEFPDKDVYLDPTTIYFSELEQKEQNPASWQEETSIELFKMFYISLKACDVTPRANDDLFYVYDYGFKYMSDASYKGYIIEFNSDGILVDHKEGHEVQQHVHFKWSGGPEHPTDQ